jgi:hypothetical protein
MYIRDIRRRSAAGLGVPARRYPDSGRRIMFGKILAFSALAAFLAVQAEASDYSHGSRISRLAHINGTLYVGLADPPPQCTAGPWNGFSLKIYRDHPSFKDIEAILLTAYTSNEKVDLWYALGTDTRCSTEGSLADLYGAGYTR